MRSVFNSPTVWAHQLSYYIFGTYFIFGGVYALRHGAMINIDIVVSRFRPRTQAIIAVISFLIFAVFMAVLIWKGAHLTYYSIKMHEAGEPPWGPPIFPLKLLIPLGAVLLLLQGLAKAIRDLTFAITGTELQ